MFPAIYLYWLGKWKMGYFFPFFPFPLSFALTQSKFLR